MKVFISADLEGVAGVHSPESMRSGGKDYEKCTEWMTLEVIAAIQGAQDAGATEFVVADSHEAGDNILLDRLPSDISITVVRGLTHPLGMMEGINKTYSEIIHTNESFFSAAFFIGYHTRASSSQGVLSHTFNSALFSDVRVNDIPVSEAFVNAPIAAQYGVPIILLTGDKALKDEIQFYARECGVFRRGKDGFVESAVVKESVGRTSVHTMTPITSQALIRRLASPSLQDFRMNPQDYALPQLPPSPPHSRNPVTLAIDFVSAIDAEVCSFLPNFQRTGPRTIACECKDIVEANGVLRFLSKYRQT